MSFVNGIKEPEDMINSSFELIVVDLRCRGWGLDCALVRVLAARNLTEDL